VALAEGRCAVTVYLPGPPPANEEEESHGSAAVYVITFPPSPDEEPGPAAPTVATAVRVAEWKDLKDEQPIIDLAFSPDGKRLVAAMLGCGAKDDDACFVELDPTGKQPPRPLFDMYKAYYPQFTPDSKGLVLLRTTHENEKIREVVLWQPGAAEVVLARLPGDLGKAYTTWYWLPDGRLRIYHISDEGVRLIETTVDGKKATARLMSHERLKAARHLADVQFQIDRPGKIPMKVDEVWDKAFTAQMKAVETPMDAADKAARTAIEEAWKAVIRWDSVPAVAPIPPVTPDVVVPQTPGTAPDAVPVPVPVTPVAPPKP